MHACLPVSTEPPINDYPRHMRGASTTGRVSTFLLRADVPENQENAVTAMCTR